MVGMEQPQTQPIHWDTHKRTINILLFVSMGAAILGVVNSAPVLVIMGLGLGAYAWLTTPKQYLIFPDALVIVYGTPRRRAIPFAYVSHVEFLSLPPMGDRLRVRLVSGRAIQLIARDSATFHDRLDEALENFHGNRPTEEPQEDDRQIQGEL